MEALLASSGLLTRWFIPSHAVSTGLHVVQLTGVRLIQYPLTIGSVR